ncbi:MAG: LuxR C-terminal-related transcriptional regulator [Rhizobiaceae bacterium]
MRGGQVKKSHQLSRIQQDLMDLVIEGCGISEIGQRVSLSEISVSIVVKSAVEKMGAKNLAHAAILYYQQKNE